MPHGAIFEMKKLYFDVATSANAPALGGIVQLAPRDHIMLGTDYPYVAMASTVPDLLKAGFSESDLRAIERDNAAALFPRFKT